MRIKKPYRANTAEIYPNGWTNKSPPGVEKGNFRYTIQSGRIAGPALPNIGLSATYPHPQKRKLLASSFPSTNPHIHKQNQCTSEINIHFTKPGNLVTRNTLTYLIWNYKTKNGRQYKDFPNHRIYTKPRLPQARQLPWLPRPWREKENKLKSCTLMPQSATTKNMTLSE